MKIIVAYFISMWRRRFHRPKKFALNIENVNTRQLKISHYKNRLSDNIISTENQGEVMCDPLVKLLDRVKQSIRLKGFSIRIYLSVFIGVKNPIPVNMGVPESVWPSSKRSWKTTMGP